MRLIFIVAAAWAVLCGRAFGEIEGRSGPWEYSLGAEATAVVSVGESDAVDREAALFELGVDGRVERVLENGAEVGARIIWRGQRDHPARTGAAGCAADGDMPGVSPFSGVATGCAEEDHGPRGALEAAYLYIDGGYGELTAGRDTGVAARFYEGPQEIFTHARSADALLDPSGQAYIRLRSDLTGPSAKISYATPRLLGLRAGLSYTPSVEARGLDWDPVRPIGGLARPDIESVWEGAVNFSRRFRDSGLRIRAGVSYLEGDLSISLLGPELSGNVAVTSAGVELEWERFSLGAAASHADNDVSGGDYDAWSLGAKTRGFGFDWAFTVSRAEDSALRTISRGVSAGIAIPVGETRRMTIGYQLNRLETPDSAADSHGAVLEITQSF